MIIKQHEKKYNSVFLIKVIFIAIMPLLRPVMMMQCLLRMILRKNSRNMKLLNDHLDISSAGGGVVTFYRSPTNAGWRFCFFFFFFYSIGPDMIDLHDDYKIYQKGQRHRQSSIYHHHRCCGDILSGQWPQRPGLAWLGAIDPQWWWYWINRNQIFGGI